MRTGTSIYKWDFCCYNFHIFRFSSFRFSGKGEVNVYRMCMIMCMCMCMCMCFIVSIPCRSIRSSRHQGVSPPRNHHATNQAVCALRSHYIMVEIKNRLIYIETRLSAGQANAWWYYGNQLSSSISTQIPSSRSFSRLLWSDCGYHASCWIHKALSVSFSQSRNRERWGNTIQYKLYWHSLKRAF